MRTDLTKRVAALAEKRARRDANRAAAVPDAIIRLRQEVVTVPVPGATARGWQMHDEQVITGWSSNSLGESSPETRTAQMWLGEDGAVYRYFPALPAATLPKWAPTWKKLLQQPKPTPARTITIPPSSGEYPELAVYQFLWEKGLVPDS